MSIIASDIVRVLSVAAAAGDTTAGTPATSLGDQASTSVITTAQTGNIFRAITGAEAAAGVVQYRCIFVRNDHATLTLANAAVQVASQASGGSTATLALDNIAVSAKGAATAQAATIPDEFTAPSGVGAFGAGPLTIGDMAPGTVKGVWIKMTTVAGATAANPDSFVLRVTGDSLP